MEDLSERKIVWSKTGGGGWKPKKKASGRVEPRAFDPEPKKPKFKVVRHPKTGKFMKVADDSPEPEKPKTVEPKLMDSEIRRPKVKEKRYGLFGPKKGTSKRIEPKFDVGTPKVNSSSPKSSPSSGKSTPSNGSIHPGVHSLVINKDKSIDYHTPEGEKHQFMKSASHDSTVHKMVLNGVRKLKDLEPDSTVHVHDHSGGYLEMAKKVKSTTKRDFPSHMVHTGTKNNSLGEEATMQEATTKYAPKKLKDVVLKPSRKWSELDGNTEDEKEIIAKMRANIVKHPDRNGNGDDVFSGANIKRDEKPVVPGDDEKKYADWNGDVKNVGDSYDEPRLKFGLSSLRKEQIKKLRIDEDTEDLNEEKGSSKIPSTGGFQPISGSHIDHHWAAKHIAPMGSSIRADGNDAVIRHPNGEIHHIENGAVHQNDMPRKAYVERDATHPHTHANAGKFNVVRTTYGPSGNENGKTMQFVSQRKKYPTVGGHLHTKDENDAHEFKNYAHARNYVNVVNHTMNAIGDGGYPQSLSIHAKRTPAQIKKSRAAFNANSSRYMAALKRHGSVFHPKVIKAHNAMMSALHPAWH